MSVLKLFGRKTTNGFSSLFRPNETLSNDIISNLTKNFIDYNFVVSNLNNWFYNGCGKSFGTCSIKNSFLEVWCNYFSITESDHSFINANFLSDNCLPSNLLFATWIKQRKQICYQKKKGTYKNWYFLRLTFTILQPKLCYNVIWSII